MWTYKKILGAMLAVVSGAVLSVSAFRVNELLQVAPSQDICMRGTVRLILDVV